MKACGSNVHGYDGNGGRRIPPLMMGHKVSGIVNGVGSEVSTFRIGELVTFAITSFVSSQMIFPTRATKANV